jgi:hypothetical protein
MSETPEPTAVRARWISGVALGVACSLVGFVILRRIGRPVELEWMTGSILDHIERVTLGKPVYVAPSSDWIPFLYPPGYYWVAAAFAKFTSLVMAARLVSLLSTMVAATCAYFLARAVELSKFWSLMAPALFIACFTKVSHWFDIERCDPMFVALLATAALTSIKGERVWHAAIVGALLAFACITKQQAFFTFVALFAVHSLARRWRDATALAATFVLVLGVLVAFLQTTTDGWFGYYCWSLPRAHGIEPELITVFLIMDHAKFPIFSLVTAFGIWRFMHTAKSVTARRTIDRLQQRQWILLAFLVSAWASSGLSRMHLGGFPNVLLPWVFFASIGTAQLASVGERMVQTISGVGRGLLWAIHGLLCLQVLGALEDPSDAIPTTQADASAEQLRKLVAALEARADVLVTGRGHVTKKRHFHMAALMDVFRHGDTVPALREDLQKQRFSGIILDSTDELFGGGVLKTHQRELSMFREAVEHYCIYMRLPKAPAPVVGFNTRPLWLLLPRAQRLPTMSNDELMRVIEMESAVATSVGQARSLEAPIKQGACEEPLTLTRAGVHDTR